MTRHPHCSACLACACLGVVHANARHPSEDRRHQWDRKAHGVWRTKGERRTKMVGQPSVHFSITIFSSSGNSSSSGSSSADSPPPSIPDNVLRLCRSEHVQIRDASLRRAHAPVYLRHGVEEGQDDAARGTGPRTRLSRSRYGMSTQTLSGRLSRCWNSASYQGKQRYVGRNGRERREDDPSTPPHCMYECIAARAARRNVLDTPSLFPRYT